MKRLGFVGGVLVFALVAAVSARAAIDDPDPVVIVHWANSHPTREGLMFEMAEQFNDGDHETADGRPIEVLVVKCDSSDQAADLVERVGGPTAEAQCQDDSDAPAANPTIITPQSDDWLLDVNNAAQREVIVLDSTQSIAETWMGIVTYRAMAECMGWPDKHLGYAEVIEVLQAGWSAYPDCAAEADADWGDPPKLAFTNPNTSTSGRNVLVTLYTMYAGLQSPADLTMEDIQDADVLRDVKSFQTLVDHYMPTTLLVNTKIAQGPTYGAFFLMPEDNLANLLLGNERAIGQDGKETEAVPDDELVMLYPKEGAVLNSNPAALVNARWVTEEAAEAAEVWIEYLRAREQQESFMEAGFRPAEGTGVTLDANRFESWGLDPEPPKATIDPGGLEPEVLQRILDQWGSVKKPAIVTFVVDVSGSMTRPSGSSDEPRIDQVKSGLLRLLSTMGGPDSAGQDSRVGLVTFGEDDDGKLLVDTVFHPEPLKDVQGDMADVIRALSPQGNTPLYDAIQQAVEITQAAEGEDGATRAVVVLSDGEDNLGDTCLHDLVTMESLGEADVDDFCGKVDDSMELTDLPRSTNGKTMPVEEVRGTGSKLADDVQVFFIGFGEAEINIGRILAEATDAEYVQTNDDLAKVIEALSGYF